MTTIVDLIMHQQSRLEKEQKQKMAQLEAERKEGELVKKMTNEEIIIGMMSGDDTDARLRGVWGSKILQSDRYEMSADKTATITLETSYQPETYEENEYGTQRTLFNKYWCQFCDSSVLRTQRCDSVLEQMKKGKLSVDKQKVEDGLLKRWNKEGVAKVTCLDSQCSKISFFFKEKK